MSTRSKAEGRENTAAQDRLLIANNREPCLPFAVCRFTFADSRKKMLIPHHLAGDCTDFKNGTYWC